MGCTLLRWPFFIISLPLLCQVTLWRNDKVLGISNWATVGSPCTITLRGAAFARANASVPFAAPCLVSTEESFTVNVYRRQPFLVGVAGLGGAGPLGRA